MNYLDYTEMDLQNEKALLREYASQLRRFPEGRLVCKKINGTLQYYHVHVDGKETILDKGKLDLIQDLRMKKRLNAACKRLRQNIRAQETMIKQYKTYEPRYINTDLPFSYKDDTLEIWANKKYRQNSYRLDLKLFTTSFGLKVRSKSEVLIAELLHAAGIPFRYEPEIILYDKDNKIHKFCPDFVIKLPDGTYIYWEHWGLFSDEGYRQRNYRKLENYFHTGIILSENLIITMDTEEGGIDAMSVLRVIQGQILPHFTS